MRSSIGAIAALATLFGLLDNAAGDMRGAPPPETALHAGDRLTWRVADSSGVEDIVYTVLAAGPNFLLQTNLQAFEFDRTDYELFVEVGGIAFFDCRSQNDEAETRAALDAVDALFPLEPGKSAGRFTVVSGPEESAWRPQGLMPDESAPLEVWQVREKLEGPSGVTLYWTPATRNLIGADWSGNDTERLIAVRRATPGSVGNAVPQECRESLPDWFWERIGLAEK